MSKEDNVVSFNTGLDVRNHRLILDFLAKINVENSMAYLPMTIHDPNVEQEEYVEYLYNYVRDEVDCLIADIAETDPKLWTRAAESLKEQLEKSKHLIRFVVALTSFNSDIGDVETEVHELVLIWDTISEAYVLINYAYNHNCLVSIATNEYLDPFIEGFVEQVVTEIRR